MTSEMTFSEIAKELGISRRSVKQAYKRAMSKIRCHPLMPRLLELYAAKEELLSQRDYATRILSESKEE